VDHVATLQDYLTCYQAMERKVMEDHRVDVMTPEIKEIVAEKRINAFDAFTRYLLSTCPDLPLEFKFGTLHSAFEQLRQFHTSGETDMSKCPSLYTKDTVVEFHYLLVTVLAGYKAGLEVLGTQCDVDYEGRPPYRPEHYDLAWMFTFLLWRIAHSSIL
jgi:hypothetical protein